LNYESRQVSALKFFYSLLVLKELQKWGSTQKEKENLLHNDLKNCAIEIAFAQKKIALTKHVLETFEVTGQGEKFIDSVKNFIKKGLFKEVSKESENLNI